MKNKFRNLLLPFLLILPLWLPAAINPVYKECMQRDYQVDGDYCVFPDSTRCLLEEFNNGECGQKWLTDDYCIKEGRYVWDAEKCCPGLVAYLPEGMAGQATCQPESEVIIQKTMDNSLIWMGLLLLGLVVLLLFLRKQGKRNSRGRR